MTAPAVIVAEALALADQLDAVPDTGADPDLIVEAAASLRLLCCLLDLGGVARVGEVVPLGVLEVRVLLDALASLRQAVSCDSKFIERVLDRLFDSYVCDPSHHKERDHDAQEVSQEKVHRFLPLEIALTFTLSQVATAATAQAERAVAAGAACACAVAPHGNHGDNQQ